jgi:hypothetical protein
MHHTMTVAVPARTVTTKLPAVAVKTDVRTGHDIAYVTRGHASGCADAMAYYTRTGDPRRPRLPVARRLEPVQPVPRCCGRCRYLGSFREAARVNVGVIRLERRLARRARDPMPAHHLGSLRHTSILASRGSASFSSFAVRGTWCTQTSCALALGKLYPGSSVPALRLTRFPRGRPRTAAPGPSSEAGPLRAPTRR